MVEWTVRSGNDPAAPGNHGDEIVVKVERETMPRRRTDLSCRVVEDEALLHDPRRGATHRLNCSAYRIWEQCDGTRTCADIARRLAESWRVPAEQACTDVLGAVRDMLRHKLVEVLR